MTAPSSVLLKLFLLVLGAGGLVLVLWLASLTLEPHPSLKSLTVSNLLDRSATLSWSNDVPTKGRVYVNKTGKFALFPNPNQGLLDDQLKAFHRNIRLDTHLVTIAGLSPDTLYYAQVYQGIWGSKVYSFKTLPSFNVVSVPNPVYGKILETDKKTAAAGVIVYLTLKNASSSATLSALTTSNGAWQLDLANVKVSGGKEPFPLTPATTLKLVIEAGRRGRVQAILNALKLTPVPNIVLPHL